MRNGTLIGLLAGAFALLISMILDLRSLPFAPAAAGQAVIDVLPGWIAVPLIEHLKEWAKRALIAAMVAAFLAAAALAGSWLQDGRSPRAVAALGLAPWLLAVALSVPAKVEPVTTFMNAALSGAAFLAALAWLGATVPGTGAAPGRRRVLTTIAAASAALAVAGVIVGPGVRAAFGSVGNVPFAA
ncbi:MAG: hypothetical protein FJ034_05030, partial [Chloroflexi bacterium]|nr:hypothetical protein [Chloroflexota bacterium]